MDNLHKLDIVLILVLVVGSGVLGFYLIERNEQVNYYQNILYMYGLIGNEYGTSGNKYYDTASLEYEQKEWDNVVRNCELAREDFSDASQEAREDMLEVQDKQGEIFEVGELMFKEEVKIYNNLYEACEHFESAVRYYKIYYDPKTPSSDTSFVMGNGEIDNMNDKIKAHDIAVNEYNLQYAKVNKLIKEVK